MPELIWAVFGAVLAAAQAGPAPIGADAADENPITAAGDAFGTSVNGESIGLYQAGNVRGFSPVDAGNVRMEGLYFDQQAAFTGRLSAGTTIRVGPATLGDPFPAPTGIVDVRLRKPGAESGFRIAPQVNQFGGTQLEIDALLPLAGDRFGLAGGVGLYEHRYPEGGDAAVRSAALIPRWQPADGVKVLPFWSMTDTRDMDINPVILVDGVHLPPKISRHRYASQSWATIDRTRTNYGVLATALAGRWTARAGIFRSVEAPRRSFSMQFRDTAADGTAERFAIANPAQRFASTSGEVRLSRSRTSGPRAHQFHFSVRAREQARRYGGTDRVSLGPGRIGEHAPVPEPDFSFGPQTRDDVRQWTGSLAYEGRWTSIGELSLGVQKARYSKQVTPPGGALPASRDDPWLYSASAAVHLGPSVTLYANHARGLEESPIAPEAAANRDEAPPAVQTEQSDFGLRWQAPLGIQVIAGRFRIEKPYFSTDREQVFRRLGEQRRQGFELSVSGEPTAGLTLVAGAMLMDPTVQVGQSEAGTGDRPVGSSRRHIMVNLDYRPTSLPAASFDLSARRMGAQYANLDNTLSVPAATLVDLGARYRFSLGGARGTLRLQALNLLDTFSWEVRGHNTFGYNSPRQLNLRVTLDY